MNTPVSFQMAELLKEKGFDKPGYLQNVWLGNKYEERGKGKNKKFVEIPVFGLGSSSVLPTISDVVMWLHEKNGIWIEVRHIKTFNVNRFHVIIWDYKDTSDYMTIYCDNGVGYEVWDSPAEAYEAAIEYVLTNLI